MADTTAIYGFPFQEATDPPDGASLGQDLAEAIETVIDSIDDRVDTAETEMNTAQADIDSVEARTRTKPIGRIIQGAAQALADNTQVAVTFAATDVIDTHAQHDPSSNNTRVTPNLAGYYRFTGTGFFEALTTPVICDVGIRLNGSSNLAPADRFVPASGNAFSLATSAIQAMNGTTDYVELVVRQDSAGADNTNVSSQFSSVLEWEFLRDL